MRMLGCRRRSSPRGITSVAPGWNALKQRRRETGAFAPHPQTKIRSRALAGQEERLATLILARPDATLAELRDALPPTAGVSTLWRTIGQLGFTLKKNRTRRRT